MASPDDRAYWKTPHDFAEHLRKRLEAVAFELSRARPDDDMSGVTAIEDELRAKLRAAVAEANR